MKVIYTLDRIKKKKVKDHLEVLMI